MSEKKILIVDDEIVLAEVLQQILIAEGYEVTTAYNGLLALEQFQKSKPNLIITDFMMPYMNGIEFIKEIRSSAANDDVAIVLTSSMANVAEFKNEGWQLFIKKPVDIDVMINSIIEVLESSL